MNPCSYSAQSSPPLLRALSLRVAFMACVAFVASGCVVVVQKQTAQNAATSESNVRQIPTKPSVPMSDELVRSELGDMVSLLPEGWSLVNIETNLPVQVFGVAVNSQYTASVTYSALRKEENFDERYKKEGIVGIGKISLSKRDSKVRNIRRIGDFEEVAVGAKRFCFYRYTADNGATLNRVAVFRSSFGNYYECTLSDLTFTGRKIVPREEMEELFLSIVAAIDF